MQPAISRIFAYCCAAAAGLLLTVAKLPAQNPKFVRGYIVTLDQDTVEGFIFDERWESSPETVQFRKKGESEAQIYTPLDILGFFTSQQRMFESKTVTRYALPPSLAGPNAVPDTLVPPRQVFLHVIVKARMTLYELTDKDGNQHFYLQEEALGPEELRIRERRVPAGTGAVLGRDSLYIRQLRFFMSEAECPAIQEDIPKTELTLKDLKRLVLQFNQCTFPESFAFIRKPSNVRARLGLVAGMMGTKLFFESDGFSDLEEADFDMAWNPSAGGALELLFGKKLYSFSLHNEFTLRYYRPRTVFNKTPSTDLFINFDLAYVKMSNLFRIWIPAREIHPFLHLGVSHAYAFSTYNRITTRTHTVETESPAIMPFRKLERSFAAGLGASYHRYTAEVRYELGNGMSGVDGLRSGTHSVTVWFGYWFGRHFGEGYFGGK